MLRGFKLGLLLSDLGERFFAFIRCFQKSLMDSPLLLSTTLYRCTTIDVSCFSIAHDPISTQTAS
jgi:hypothetical protein